MDATDFGRVIALTPLVSIDLVLRNAKGQVLLGYRHNRPAQHTWFVPGGRIRKDERLEDAWKRIAQVELGALLPPPRLLGVYQHFYDDNAPGLEGVTTHYVVVACEARLPEETTLRPDRQHGELRWWNVDELLASGEVHVNTKAYFGGPAPAFSLPASGPLPS